VIILRGVDRENASRYRDIPVLIAGGWHVHPTTSRLPLLMEECFLRDEEQNALLHMVTLALFRKTLFNGLGFMEVLLC